MCLLSLHKEAIVIDIVDDVWRLLYDVSEYLRIDERDGQRFI